MELNEALGKLANGHSIWKPEVANDVCDALGVKHIKPYRIKGQTAEGVGEVLGVDALDLSRHVARELGVDYPSKIGRGFQAQEIARALARHLKKED